MAIAKDIDNIVIGAISTLTLGGVDLGPVTEDGVVLNIEKEYFDHKNDQVKATVKKTLTNRRITVALTLVEPTPANLLIAAEEAAASLSAEILTLDDTQSLNAALVIVAPPVTSASDVTRTITLTLVKAIGNPSMTMSKSGEALLPLEFEAIYDMANDKFGDITDA